MRALRGSVLRCMDAWVYTYILVSARSSMSIRKLINAVGKTHMVSCAQVCPGVSPEPKEHLDTTTQVGVIVRGDQHFLAASAVKVISIYTT